MVTLAAFRSHHARLAGASAEVVDRALTRGYAGVFLTCGVLIVLGVLPAVGVLAGRRPAPARQP